MSDISPGAWPPRATLLGVYNGASPELCRALAEYFEALAAEARRAAGEAEDRASRAARSAAAATDWRGRLDDATAVLRVRLAAMPPAAAILATARETGISRQALAWQAVHELKGIRASDRARRDRRIRKRAAAGWTDKEIAAAEGISARQVSRIVARRHEAA